jgi:hypothetical protein
MKIYLTILLFICGLGANAQSSIKLEKQPTKFYYGQLNLHGGFVGDVNGDRFDFASRSPKNQIVFQAFSKNQKNQQRGYTRSFDVASWKFRLGLEYDSFISGAGVKTGKVNFKLLDTFVTFKTKWDRTSISVGNKSIPYGHNPKIDPVVSFMINPIKMDLGFAQDAGVFFRTPISKWADLELSVTSGGMLNKPVLVCNNIIVKDDTNIDLNPEFVFSTYEMGGTWLVTARAGSPTYQRNELGLNVVAGRILNTTIANDLSTITRLGGDWVYKYNERFKFNNQVFIGETKTSTSGDFYTLNIQNNMDFFSGKHWMLSLSHAINSQKAIDRDLLLYNSSVAGSLTYVFSPHTRLRLNSFYTYIRDANETQYGALIQFVTGLGKRP